MDLDVKKNVAMYAAIFLALFILAMQIKGLSLEPDVSQAYSTFYFDLVMVGFAGLLATVAFGLKYGDALKLPWWSKAGVTAVWIIIIIMISTSAGQILPVPKASTVNFQLTPGTELYTSSVIPAITEDWTYLWVLPMVFLLIMSLVAEYGFGVEITGRYIVVFAVIACFIASTGYNIWVVPGFTSAHVPSYGNTQNAYVGAWTFAFGQSIVYVFTGWFLPIAHGIHNFMVTYGQLFQVNIGNLSIIGG